MKKIMFNDRFGLTDAVIDGTKTMTRRMVNDDVMKGAHEYVQKVHGTGLDILDFLLDHAAYKVGEIVAIAQKYDDVMTWQRLYERTLAEDPYFPIECTGGIPGKRNKMFVKAEWMPFQIVITDVRVQRLHDISNDDCMREGILKKSSFPHRKSYPFFFKGGKNTWDNTFSTPREAFASLIDRISGNGTWKSNPWVYVYSFRLK